MPAYPTIPAPPRRRWLMLALGVLLTFAGVAMETRPPWPIWLNWDYNCLPLDATGIAQLVADAKAAGMTGIVMRVSNKGALNYRSRVGQVYHERLDAYGADYDPLRILLAEGRRQGLGAGVWFDLYEGAYDKLLNEHPEYCPQGIAGQPPHEGAQCYAEVAVRDYTLRLVDEFAAYRPDRVFFCTKSSHTPSGSTRSSNRDSGYNAPAIAKYHELWGAPIPPASYLSVKLAAIHGEFLLDFIVAARQRLRAVDCETVLGVTLSGHLQAVGNVHLDWRRALARQAADSLVVANGRPEMRVLYSAAGQQKWHEVATAARAAGVKAYPYVVASGTHSALIQRAGVAALHEYLPRQIAYLRAIGGDGLVIHDLDLLTYDAGLRRLHWLAAGQWLPAPALADPAVFYPPPPGRAVTDPLPGGVPGATDLSAIPRQWLLAPSLTDAPEAGLRNGDFEASANDRQEVQGWTAQGSAGVATHYDWRVLHGDPLSGRTFSGRSSVALTVLPQAEPGARRQASGQWQASVTLPADLPRVPLTLRGRAHGETLRGLTAAGLRVQVLDAAGQSLHETRAETPLTGTFPWRELVCQVPALPSAQTLRLTLFLQTDDSDSAAGTLWFDQLDCRPSAAAPGAVAWTLVTAGPDAGSVRHEAQPGMDLTSIAFAVAPPGKTLRITLRAEKAGVVELHWLGETRARVLCPVTPAWSTHDLAVPIGQPWPQARLLLRPHQAGSLWLRQLTLGE